MNVQPQHYVALVAISKEGGYEPSLSWRSIYGPFFQTIGGLRNTEYQLTPWRENLQPMIDHILRIPLKRYRPAHAVSFSRALRVDAHAVDAKGNSIQQWLINTIGDTSLVEKKQ